MLRLLWQLGPATARQVHEAAVETRPDMAYANVLRLLPPDDAADVLQACEDPRERERLIERAALLAEGDQECIGFILRRHAPRQGARRNPLAEIGGLRLGHQLAQAALVAAPAGADVKMKMAMRNDSKPGLSNRQVRDFIACLRELEAGDVGGLCEDHPHPIALLSSPNRLT
mgnify:CR=1 FL=1